MDVNVNVNLNPSEINGLFNEVESLKKQRSGMGDLIEVKTQKIIHHIQQHGNVLAYKDDIPYILTVGQQVATKLDKQRLASDTDVTVAELNLLGVAELVEDGRLSADQIKSYQYQEPKVVLKARKAKKQDIAFFRSRGI